MATAARAANPHQPWRGEVSQRDYTNNAIAAAPSGWRRCLRAFAQWLEDDRQLALSTITVRVASARSFLEACEGTGVRCLRRLRPSDVEDFFIDYAKQHGRAAMRSIQAALRLLFLLGRQRSWHRRDLAAAVPSQYSYRHSNTPRGMSVDDVGKLVAASVSFPSRDRAIVLLLVVYGIRRGQVSALRLDSIDWHQRTISFPAHKGGKPVMHTLTPAVAAAVCEYLRHHRGESSSDALFLREKKPRLPLSPSMVTQTVRVRIQQAGLACVPCGPHALRHAFATRLLHDGQPLKIIADLLGHRGLDAVSIYAKVDHPRMLEVASEWPEVAL